MNDWKNEKISMPFSAVENICKKRKCEIPKNVIIKDVYWYVKEAAKAGGKTTFEKYGIIGGDQNVRKEKWHEWWEKEGRLNPSKILQPLSFKKPRFSKELAEFVGIMLGDGGMTKNQVKVTLHSIDDLEYSRFVESLMKKLFDVKISRINRNDCEALDIVISRIELVKFLVNKTGLNIGNKVKHQVDIPNWIIDSNSFKKECLRGLIDTDGCVIIHKYKSKGKEYSYKKLSFTSRSLPLLNSVKNILTELEIKNRITKNNYEIRIEAENDVKKYFDIIGSHNSKHLARYRN